MISSEFDTHLTVFFGNYLLHTFGSETYY